MRATKPCDSHAPTSRAPSFSHQGMARLSNSIGSTRERVCERLQSVTLLGSSGSSCLSYKHSTLAVFPPSSNDASASKHCRICIECQRSTRCSEKTWLSSGNVLILCDSTSGRGPPSFGYHRLATVPFTTLHCESPVNVLRSGKRTRFATVSRWHGNTSPGRVVDIRPGQALAHKIVTTCACRFLGVTQVRSNDGVEMDMGGCILCLGTK